MSKVRHILVLGACVGLIFAPVGAQAQTDGERILALIRASFRAHRPPPPYVVYTMERKQQTEDGMPDFEWSYTYRIWCRSSDRAALGRRIFRGKYLALEFLRPAFNEPRDPGPPTADIFERASSQPQGIDVVPTPEPIAPPLIGSVTIPAELEYRVKSVKTQGQLVDVQLAPRRDPERNRLREIWADKNTYEISKYISTDRLFILGGPVYQQLDTVMVAQQDGIPVIREVHSKTIVDPDLGQIPDMDYFFRDIRFPAALPPWYFEPSTYGSHISEAPTG